MKAVLLTAALIVLASPALAGGVDLSLAACPGDPAASAQMIAPCADDWDSWKSDVVICCTVVPTADMDVTDFRAIFTSSNTSTFWGISLDGDPTEVLAADLRRPAHCDGYAPLSPDPTIVTEERLIDNAYHVYTYSGFGDGVSQHVTAGQRLFAFRVSMGKAGDSQVTGCNEPEVLTVAEFDLYGTDADGHFVKQILKTGTGVNANISQTIRFNDTATPARAMTWGALKSLYR